MNGRRRNPNGLPETRVVCVADSEADIYELLVEGQEKPRAAGWIVRACQNRAVEKEAENKAKNGESGAALNHLRERVLAGEALRTLFVCRLGREFPQISCEAIFEQAEWKSVYRIVRDKPPPEQPPTLKAMVRMVAQLGGYVNRKRDDDPGPQTVWLGLQRTHDMALCWQTFGPEAKRENILV